MTDPLMGQIQIFACTYAPSGWLFCEGQTLLIANNTGLFSILGTTFGGDGRNNFKIPDLQGRAAIHPGTIPGAGGQIQLGQLIGTEQVVLKSEHVPNHQHDFMAINQNGDSSSPVGRLPANTGRRDNEYSGNSDGNVFKSNAVTYTGGGLGHDNMQPYQVVNFCMAVSGAFPSRS